WEKLWPFSRSNSKAARRNIISLWFKIIIACIPAAVVGLPLDDILDTYLSTPTVIAVMLIVYGVIFIILETRNRKTVFP
ncbi:MAG: undecaprenyl-diphosphate phosphatase, partial [Eubacteriales bacterium]|nr:undecaprenyl-diphosphate phosphatase [Eubacteriales bacterium]